jgi:hypothetical protein
MRPASIPTLGARTLPARNLPLRLGYLVVISAGIYIFFGAWAYDDPFITYRYAENLIRGLGFVYNPGERILSTTTPLFTLLLAALGLISPHFPVWANLIGAFSLAAGGLLLWDLASSWGAPLVGWAGLLLYPTFPLLLTTLGSETPIYLALCLGAFAFYARGQLIGAALCAGLAVLARPDGVLVALLLAGDTLLRLRRPVPWRAVALFAGILLAWVAFAWAYFGSPLPVTLAAKQQQGAMAVSQLFAPGFFTILRWYARLPYVVEAGLSATGLVFAARRARAWSLFLAWPFLYFAAYSVLGVSRYFWYYAPLVPGFVASIGLGVSALAIMWRSIFERRGDVKPSGDSPAPAWGCRAALALLALLFLAQVNSLGELRGQADQRFPIYRAVGEWLGANTRQEERVGALEVGIIGYYAKRPVVDFAGLVQPSVAEHFGEGTSYEDAAIWAMSAYRPEYLVLQEGSFPRLEAGFVSQNCRLAEHFPGEPYGYEGSLNVFACRK